ncbi:hypothetical protein PCE1_003000 [Barthelona sp. PCE]
MSSDILFCGFNQNTSCLAVGTDHGFTIFNTEPFSLNIKRIMEAGIGLVSMVYRTNVVGLVGGGNPPRFAPSKAILWDDHRKRVLGEITLSSPVKNMLLNASNICIALEDRVLVYKLDNLMLMHEAQTVPNEGGVLALSGSRNSNIMASLTCSVGEILIYNLLTQTSFRIEAHKSPIKCLALSDDGKWLATASVKGTLIRVFDLSSHDPANPSVEVSKRTFRRGTDQASITSIAFSPAPDNRYLACTSDHGTIHIFSLLEGRNPRPKLHFLRGMSEYFDCERSLITFKLEDTMPKVGFLADDQRLVCVTSQGSFYGFDIDVNNNTLNPYVYENFVASLTDD